MERMMKGKRVEDKVFYCLACKRKMALIRCKNGAYTAHCDICRYRIFIEAHPDGDLRVEEGGWRIEDDY